MNEHDSRGGNVSIRPTDLGEGESRRPTNKNYGERRTRVDLLPAEIEFLRPASEAQAVSAIHPAQLLDPSVQEVSR